MTNELGNPAPAPDNTGAAGGQGTDQTTAAPAPANPPANPEAVQDAASTGGDNAPLLNPEAGEPEGDAPLLTPDDGEGGDAEEAGAPERYEDFNLPEGFELAGEEKDSVFAMFKGMNLSQANAQKLVDYFTNKVMDQQVADQAALVERRKAWRAEVRQRENYATERALALKGLRAVVTEPDEKALFTDSWLSDHPAFFKVFTKIGALVGEDSPPRGDGSPAPGRDLNLQRFPVA